MFCTYLANKSHSISSLFSLQKPRNFALFTVLNRIYKHQFSESFSFFAFTAERLMFNTISRGVLGLNSRCEVVYYRAKIDKSCLGLNVVSFQIAELNMQTHKNCILDRVLRRQHHYIFLQTFSNMAAAFATMVVVYLNNMQSLKS